MSESETTATPETTRAKRTAGLLDPAAGTVQIGDAIYDASTLPTPVQAYLMVLGLRHHLRGEAPEAAYQALVEGIVPETRAAAGGRAMSDLRKAIARALLATARKAKRPLSMVEAEAAARGLSREDAETWRRNPDVVRELATPDRPVPSLADLLPPAPVAEAA